MKLRKIISTAVTAAVIMADTAVITTPSVYAENVNTDTAYRENFDGFANANYSPTLKGLKSYGWYAADNNTLYTTVDSVPPYSTYEGKFAKITDKDGSKVLMVVSAGEGNSTQNGDIPEYGYAKTFPGVNAGEAVTGSWEISFDFKPYLLNKMTQFAFTLNTADKSDLTQASAQHNIIAGYGQRFYLGYRNYKTLLNDNSAQGTLKAVDIGGEAWYRVRTVLNCDEHYYSVELYNRATGKLIARRSPVSFDANESVGFLKFSALGFKQHSWVYIDNVSIEKTAKNALIYNESFDTFTNSSYRATDGMTTAEKSEDLTGNSYFEGFTPWRFYESIGNSYCLENDSILSSQVVRLGDNPETAGVTEKSGLVYMPSYDPIIDQQTANLRGMLKASFKIKPETIADTFTVNVIPDTGLDIASNSSEIFKIANNSGTPAVLNNGEYVGLDRSKWYDAELIFDVLLHTVTVRVKDIQGNDIAYNCVSDSSVPDAIKAIMFKADRGTSVLADDIRLEYLDRVLNISEVCVNGKSVDYLPDIDAPLTVNVTMDYVNSGDETLNSEVILALYSDGRLISVQSADFSLLPKTYGTDDETVAFTIPSDVDTDAVDKMSVFVWDGLDCMRCFTKKINSEKKQESIYKDYVDFTVDIKSGRDAVILQLTDTQIVDSTQIRPEVTYNPAMPKYWLPELMNRRLFNDLREIINNVKPDLILLTGDMVYGGYDDKGTSFVELADFLDGYGIPWAPVFGNHENESQMGVDWQCDYLENCKNCLFKQRTLTGNGNYSIGIVQGGELKRVIFMLDSNGCAVMSDESFSNGHSKKTAGFGDDQIEWYSGVAQKINKDFGDMKYTFAFHIQLAAFEDAFYNTYGFVNGSERNERGDLVSPINIDKRADKQPTDFGYIGRNLKGPWDKDRTVYNGIKALGADSILVGHEHCNSASVVYDGIRFQYGQKIGEYDRINFRNSDGSIVGASAYASDLGTPILGGTVMELSESTGEISNAYIYYCSK